MSSTVGSFDTATTNVLAETSQDTIRILIALARETDIYHAQQRTFNHFLETALASLLLLLCYAEAEYRVGYLPDVLAAMELVQHLSLHSPVTRALKQKLHRVQSMIKSFRVSNHPSAQQSPRSGSAPAGDQFGDSATGGRSSHPPSRPNEMASAPTPTSIPMSLAPVMNNDPPQGLPPSGQLFPPAAALAEMAMGASEGGDGSNGGGPFTPGPSQPPFGMSQMNTPQQFDDGFGSASLHSQQSASDSTSMMDFVASHDLSDLPNDFFTNQFPDLGDIIKDYDNFRF